MEKKIEVKNHFNYHHKTENVILDTQYNYEGKYLAVGDISGQISFYGTQAQQKKFLFSHQQNKCGVLKISWSLPHFGNLIAAAFIDKYITVYQMVEAQKTKELKLVKLMTQNYNCIPTTIAFCPFDQKLILAVGLSNGTIQLYHTNNGIWNTLFNIEAHEMTTNCISWQIRFIISNKKIEWVKKNFNNMNINKSQCFFPLLASVSSDKCLKIWKFENDKLIQIAKIEAHKKQIRQVCWKPQLFQQQKLLLTCSQDGFVKIWSLKCKEIMLISQIQFNSVVWKASWNPLGNIVVISISKEQELETKIYTQQNGILTEYSKIEAI